MQVWPRILSLRLLVLLFVLPAVRAHAQLPPPGYNSHWRTADGTEKLALEFGGGWDISNGPSRTTQTRGWNYLMGSGYNFNRRFALLGEYSFNRFTIPVIIPSSSTVIPPSGSIHIWSLTADPKYQYFASDRVGAYVIVGGGVYRKVLSPGGVCSGSCATTIANAPGANFGAGIALKVSDNSNAKFYAEIRYVWIDTQPPASEDLYAALDTRTSYAPITLGIRW
jgi:hypothetical protein